MIRKKKKNVGKQIIDLTGPGGNAFYLLGSAQVFCRELDLDYTEIKREMMGGDYENLVQVFDKYFGDFVILER